MGKPNCVHPGCVATEDGCKKIECKAYGTNEDGCKKDDLCAFVNKKCQPKGNLVFVILYHRFKEWKPMSKNLFENISKFIKCKKIFQRYRLCPL